MTVSPFALRYGGRGQGAWFQREKMRRGRRGRDSKVGLVSPSSTLCRTRKLRVLGNDVVLGDPATVILKLQSTVPEKRPVLQVRLPLPAINV